MTGWPSRSSRAMAVDQLPHVVDRPVGQRPGRLDQRRVGPIGQPQVQGHLLAVEHVDEALLVARRLLAADRETAAARGAGRT